MPPLRFIQVKATPLAVHEERKLESPQANRFPGLLCWRRWVGCWGGGLGGGGEESQSQRALEMSSFL